MPFIGRSGETAFLPSSVNTSSSLTVTGGDLIVDTDTLFVDESANRVGIGTVTPATMLEVGNQSQTLAGAITVSNGEIIGGGERTWSEEEILARIDAEGVPREPYQFYIDTRTYGGVPHGGFGLGVDRVVSWLSGADHIREVIPFPRDSRRVTP